MFIVGLTGGIGSGKSAVADMFREQGITVVDADIAARQVVVKGSPALSAIANHYGRDILLPDGTLNRSKLRDIIFADETAKQWLEALLHPLIGKWIKEELASAASPYAILESPLLIEAGQDQLSDRILVVDLPEILQQQRAAARDNADPEQIRAIMASQLPRNERLAKADDIVDNSETLEQTREQVLQLHQQYLKLASHDQSKH